MSQFFTNAVPDSPTKGNVVETGRASSFVLFLLFQGYPEPLRIKGVWGTLVDAGSLVRVPNTVHHTPALGNLVALQEADKTKSAPETAACRGQLAKCPGREATPGTSATGQIYVLKSLNSLRPLCLSLSWLIPKTLHRPIVASIER